MTADLSRALTALRSRAPGSLRSRVFAEWVRVPGPIGDVFVASTTYGIARVMPAEVVGGDDERFTASFTAHFDRPIVPGERIPDGVERALETGDGRGLRYDLRGLSPFEYDVLMKTLEIPAGQVRPYGWVAREIGRPGAVRATGSALGRNPVPLLIPCHRVTRSDGTPGNYAFGPALKERLLRAEHVDLTALRPYLEQQD
jgi:O-6-methylguanine DNA methyltransferase